MAEKTPYNNGVSSCCCGPRDLHERSFDGWRSFLFADLRTSLTTACGALLIIGAVMSVAPSLPRAAVDAVVVASVLCGAVFSVKEAAEALIAKSLDVNLLMVLAAIGAVALGDFFEAAGLLFLFSLSGTLEAYAMTRTKSAIASLMSLRPDTALVVTNSEERIVPVKDVLVGQTVRVAPFNAIPVDGTITAGMSSLDQSVMTGESRSISAGIGDTVLAGTQNLEGLIELTVTRAAGDSTLDKIVGLVQEAQENKASGERISAWFGEKYTLLVLGSFTASLLVRMVMLRQAWTPALYDSLTLLVGMSPCALVISTPATTLSALAWAARNGMLIRGGEFIEKAGTITAVAFDKTGTLTEGRPRLTEVCVCEAPVKAGADDSEDSCWMGKGTFSPAAQEIVAYAAAAERYSNHPLALALQRAAEEAGIALPDTNKSTVVPGKGIKSQIGGKSVLIGSRGLITSEGVSVPHHLEDRISRMQSDGLTASFIAIGEHVAVLGFKDTLRPGVAKVMEELRALGVKSLTMLSGDTAQTAAAVAAEAGLTEARGELLPDQKVEYVRRLAESGSVMMFGDGVNDAPSLAAATVGVAMGGLGSDVALNAADVVLMRDDLTMAGTLMRLGRRTNAIIKANLFFAAGVVIALTGFSLAGQLPLLLAVVCHEGSTVVVILSGLRLLKGPLKLRVAS